MDCFFVERIDSVKVKALKVMLWLFINIRILTEGFKLVEADGALALRCLDAACVEDVIALEEPDLLLVPLEVEFKFAAIAPV